jgi:hypothetical protein
VGSSGLFPSPGQPTTGADPNFKQAALPQLVQFKFAGVEPPSVLYIQRDDSLLILVNSFVGGNIFVSARLLLAAQSAPGQPDQQPPQPSTPTGVLNPIVTVNQQFVINASTNLQAFTMQLQEGYLLSLRVSADVSSTTRGQTFVRVLFNRGTPTAGVTVGVLLADYAYPQAQISWPYGRVITPLEGPGDIRALAVGNPAAGTDWTFTCPANTRLRICSLQATFTASAAVANRQVQLIVDDGTTPYWTDDGTANITAGQVAQVAATTTNAPAGIITTVQDLVFPPSLYLVAGHRIRTSTVGIQAGDQWSLINIAVERWLDNV